MYCNKSTSQSERLYNQHCGSCHLGSGEGVGSLVPSLVNTTLFSTDRNQLICLTKNGVLSEDGSEFSYAMPANESLSDTEITNILNYVRKRWHGGSEVFSIQEIQNNLTSCN